MNTLPRTHVCVCQFASIITAHAHNKQTPSVCEWGKPIRRLNKIRWSMCVCVCLVCVCV